METKVTDFKSIMLKRILFALGVFVFFAFSVSISKAEDQMPSLIFPGQTEGEGTHFGIADSKYLNINLDSSEPIKLRTESVPEMITMMIKRATSTSASQSQIVISGFSPLTTYYKFEDDYHNLTQFITDENGKYTYIQDLSKSRFIFIQPRASTKFIKDDATGGDCYLIGIWDLPTKSCTLTMNANETIQIDDNNLTFDGNNYAIAGTNTGIGVYLYQKFGITIKNLNINDFSFGVYMALSTVNDLSQNIALNNTFGIFLDSSSGNIIKDNNINNDGGYGIYLDNSSSYNVIDNNTINSTFLGIVLRNSHNNTMKNNISKLSGYAGIYIRYADYNIFTSNSILNNHYGIYLDPANNNQFYHNNVIISTPYHVFINPGDASTGNIFNQSLPIGGNYWSNFDIPAEGCLDANDDHICDSPYYFYGGQDNLPWTKKDGWKLPPPANQPPTIATLGQFKSDKTTTISEGGITTESSFDDPKTGVVAFKAIINDPDNNQVKLQIELKEWNQPFDSRDLLESDFAASGSEVAITRNVLFERQYHWRARAVDINNNTSSWQEFGTPGNVDFIVRLVPLYTQVRSDYPSDEGTKIWAELDYAQGVAGNYGCGSKVKDCGCAITSEVMIMKFHGITLAVDSNDVNPLTFNQWLANNNGYKSNGEVRWEKIDEYSKDSQTGFTRLQYTGPKGFKDITTLNLNLVSLNPVILYEKILVQGTTTSHFIVADGKLTDTYTIKDPAYYNTKYLKQTVASFVYNYNNNFQGLRLFSTLITPRKGLISMYLASPAEMLFTDPIGRRLGKDPTNNVEYNEIPEGVYYQEGIGNPFPETSVPNEESKNIWIPDPIDGKYDIQIIGTESGSYTLDTLIYDQTGQSKDVTQEGNTSLNNIQNFELDYSATTIQQSEIYRIVDIDIKPGSYPNAINLKSKGVAPVTIITTPFFDAKNVVIDSVIFAGANPLKGKLEDVDNDKDLDLILHFNTQSLQLTTADTEAVLTGKLEDNALIKGTDSVRIIQESGKQTILSKFFSFIGQFIQNLVSAIGSIAT